MSCPNCDHIGRAYDALGPDKDVTADLDENIRRLRAERDELRKNVGKRQNPYTEARWGSFHDALIRLSDALGQEDRRTVGSWHRVLAEVDELREKVERYERDGCYPNPRGGGGTVYFDRHGNNVRTTLDDGTEI